MTHTLKNKVLEIFKIKNLEYFINNGGACDMQVFLIKIY